MTRLDEDLRAAAAAERELGAEYESAVLRSFAERLDREVDRRLEARLAGPRDQGLDWTTLLLALGSICLALGVPSATHDQFGTAATFVLTVFAWAAIVAINLAHARGRRGR